MVLDGGPDTRRVIATSWRAIWPVTETTESAQADQSVTSRIIVLDHQDATEGPRHYDLASLLNDSLQIDPGRSGSSWKTKLR